jgi:hypothetical protein
VTRLSLPTQYLINELRIKCWCYVKKQDTDVLFCLSKQEFCSVISPQFHLLYFIADVSMLSSLAAYQILTTGSDLLKRHQKIHLLHLSSRHEGRHGSPSLTVSPREPQDSITESYSRPSLESQISDHTIINLPHLPGSLSTSQNPNARVDLPGRLTHPALPIDVQQFENDPISHYPEATLWPNPATSFGPIIDIAPQSTLFNSHPSWASIPVWYDNLGLQMGSYDADIAWTLGFPYQTSLEGGSEGVLSPDQNISHLGSNHTGVLDESASLDGEDKETSDWPDRLSRPASPGKLNSPIISPDGQFWIRTIRESQTMNPEDVLVRQSYKGVVDERIRASQLDSLNICLGGKDNSLLQSFPPAEVLDYFLRLFFQYLHPRFPVTHLPTFDIDQVPPFLLTAMMILGSAHSVTNRGRFSSLFHKRARSILTHCHDADSRFVRSIYQALKSQNLSFY